MISVLIISILSGCSKDKNNKKSSYTYDGKINEIAWAGYYYDEEDEGYIFGITPKSLSGKLGNETDFFVVHYPSAKLGVKCDLANNNNSEEWSFYVALKSNNVFYYGFNNDSEYISGTDNWVKITKNTGAEDNFTIEFAITIDGKRLAGSYTGKFQKYENYSDIAVLG